MTDTTQHTVEELIEMWQDGILVMGDGDLFKPDGETLRVRFEGSDGAFETVYYLKHELSYRTDTEERFDILNDD